MFSIGSTQVLLTRTLLLPAEGRQTPFPFISAFCTNPESTHRIVSATAIAIRPQASPTVLRSSIPVFTIITSSQERGGHASLHGERSLTWAQARKSQPRRTPGNMEPAALFLCAFGHEGASLRALCGILGVLCG
jgi:hypothetical protein